MKKAFVIFLLFIYASSTMGATVHLHYCMDKLVKTDLWHADDKKCGKCGMTEKKGGCCKEEQKIVKLTTDHQKGAAAEFVKNISVPAFNTHTSNYNFTLPLIQVKSFTGYLPPPILQNCRLNILHCTYLI